MFSQIHLSSLSERRFMKFSLGGAVEWQGLNERMDHAYMCQLSRHMLKFKIACIIIMGSRG